MGIYVVERSMFWVCVCIEAYMLGDMYRLGLQFGALPRCSATGGPLSEHFREGER